MPAANSPKLTIRLEPADWDALHDLAERRQTAITALVRPLVLALIAQGRGKTSAKRASKAKTALWTE